MGMWILVVGPSGRSEHAEGAAEVLEDLGCRVRTADLRDPLGGLAATGEAPAAVLIEALDHVDAGRAALTRLRTVDVLAGVPAMIAVTVTSAQALQAEDGFDDFVLVPYVPVELYQRIRRIEWRRSEFTAPERIKIGGLCLDLEGHEVTVDGRSIALTQREFALLRFLCQNRGRVYSREQLLSRVWGVEHYGGSRTVDIHMRRLRMKLGTASIPLETVRGVGYKLKSA
jgi:DNA-binding response OmpR family regulator